MKFYLDACALNRLADDQTQLRVRKEANAVEEILGLLFTAKLEWIASRALEVELLQNPNSGMRADSLEILSRASIVSGSSETIKRRGRQLTQAGYGIFDALHLAHAEDSQVDALLTTDDRFIRQAARGLGNPGVRVVNPLDWLGEVRRWLQQKP